MDKLDDGPRPHISRRDFLKLTGVTTGAITTGGLPIPDVLPNNKEHKFDETQIKVGNLILSPILTEHSEEEWKINRRNVIERLEPFPIIIPEYFPPEYSQLAKDNSLIQPYDKSENYAFHELDVWCRKKGKEVWVVDPAYSQDFVKMMIGMMDVIPATATTAATLAVEAANAAFAHHQIKWEEEEEKENSTSRAKAKAGIVATHGLIGVSVAGIGALGVMKQLLTTTSKEFDVRHVFISNALNILGNTLPQEIQAAIIYPAAHWNGFEDHQSARGIAYYLNHPEELNKQVAKYKDGYPEKDYPDFYKIRHYQSIDNKWMSLPTLKVS